MEAKIVLIGAGSVQFGYDMMGDIFQSKVLEGSHIVLHDINASALETVKNNGDQFIEQHSLPFQLSATTSRTEALKGADFCIISIEVGDRFELWDQDWRIPQQYGIKQVFGENGGPGGLFHSLRIIPPILEICQDIQTICPDTIVFNYSNPMSRICTTVHRKFPELKFYGMCHEIASLRQHLPKILDTPFDNLILRSGGLNHFSILLKAAYKDTKKDAYPDIRQKAPAYFENYPEMSQLVEEMLGGAPVEDSASSPKLNTPSVKWPERGIFKVLLEKFDHLPITTDSHLGEYLQWASAATDHKGILDFRAFYKAYCELKQPEIKLKHSERAVDIMEGMLTDSGYEEMAVNLPNQGFIANLPEFLVVEVPAIVDKKGIHGVHLENYPKAFAGLLQNQVAVHDMTAEAVLSGSRDVVLQTLLVDPVVDDVAAAEKMLDTLLSLQKDYLGYIS